MKTQFFNDISIGALAPFFTLWHRTWFNISNKIWNAFDRDKYGFITEKNVGGRNLLKVATVQIDT